MPQIGLDPNDEMLETWKKQDRFGGKPPNTITINVPDSVVDKNGNVKDNDFIEKAVNDYLDSRYGKLDVSKSTSGSDKGEFATHKYFGDFLGRLSSLGPEPQNRGFQQGLKQGVTGLIGALNPINLVHAIRRDDLPAVMNDPTLNYQEKIAKAGGSEPITGDIIRSITDPSGEIGSLLPTAALAGIALSPKIRAAGVGAIKGISEGEYSPQKWSVPGVVGGMIGYAHDPTTHGMYTGATLGAGAGIGIDAIRNAFIGAKGLAAGKPWINARALPVYNAEFADEAKAQPLYDAEFVDETEAQQAARYRNIRETEPRLTEGSIKMGRDDMNYPNYPPGTEPEFTVSSLKQIGPGVGNRSGTAFPMPSTGMPTKPITVNISPNISPSPNTVLSKIGQDIPPENSNLTANQLASEIIDRAKTKRIGKELPNEEPIGGSEIDREIYRLQNKDVLRPHEAVKLSRLLKERGDIANDTINTKEALNLYNDPTVNEISHEELYKLADALGVKPTPLARALIQKGYNVKQSKFGSGQWGLERVNKGDWPAGDIGEKLVKMLDFMNKKSSEKK